MMDRNGSTGPKSLGQIITDDVNTNLFCSLFPYNDISHASGDVRAERAQAGNAVGMSRNDCRTDTARTGQNLKLKASHQ